MWVRFLDFLSDMYGYTLTGVSTLTFINLAITTFFTCICGCFIFHKITASKNNHFRSTVMFLFCILSGILYAFLRIYLGILFTILIMFLFYTPFILFITKTKFNSIAAISTVFSIAFSFFAYFVSIFLIVFASHIIHIHIDNHMLRLFIVGMIQAVLVYNFFRIKRFRNGFQFLQYSSNTNTSIIAPILETTTVMVIAVIILVMNVLANTYEVADYDLQDNEKVYILMSDDEIQDNIDLTIFVTVTVIILSVIFLIYKSTTSYYRLQLMQNTLNEQENELRENKENHEKLVEENLYLSSVIHKHNSKLNALEEFVKENNKWEDSSKILDDIKNLSSQFSSNIKQNMEDSQQLPATNIFGIDVLLKYFAKEANKNNIKFNLKMNGNINYMLENCIKQEQFETLLSDHIKNAIIAINARKNSDGEIMVIIGKLNGIYGICIYDNGIEFEANTYAKLGLEAITTHAGDGGSGIGFMSTFATLLETNASLIIGENQLTDDNFTKSVTIKFDNKNEYRIQTYRVDEIAELSQDNRIILDKGGDTVCTKIT